MKGYILGWKAREVISSLCPLKERATVGSVATAKFYMVTIFDVENMNLNVLLTIKSKWH